jgi:hypothetical protein
MTTSGFGECLLNNPSLQQNCQLKKSNENQATQEPRYPLKTNDSCKIDIATGMIKSIIIEPVYVEAFNPFPQFLIIAFRSRCME